MRLYKWLRKWTNIIFHPIRHKRLKKIEQECYEAFKELMVDYNRIDPNIVKWQVILECKEDSGMGKLIQIKGQEGDTPRAEWMTLGYDQIVSKEKPVQGLTAENIFGPGEGIEED